MNEWAATPGKSPTTQNVAGGSVRVVRVLDSFAFYKGAERLLSKTFATQSVAWPAVQSQKRGPLGVLPKVAT